jgi:hypothetical protein
MIKLEDMQDAVSGSFCLGYVFGIVDAMISMSLNLTTSYCIPDNADSDQLIRITVNYLNDHNAELHLPAGAIVFKPIREAFPCKAAP